MSTVGDIIDRIRRDYTSQPSDLPNDRAFISEAGGINDSVTSFDISTSGLTQEEIDILETPGTVFEVDSELFKVVSVAAPTWTVATRGTVYGTAAASHIQTAPVLVAPKPPRITLFEAVADAIVGLAPELYGTATEWADPRDFTVELPATPEPVSVVEATQLHAGEPLDVQAYIVRSEEFSTGVGLRFDPRNHTEDVFIRYTTEFSRPTAEADTLASLGVDESWERVLIWDVLAAMFVSQDVDALTQDLIIEALEVQAFQPSLGTDIGVGLTRLREAELRKAQRRLVARDGARTSFHEVL